MDIRNQAFRQINNEVYKQADDIWWNPEEPLNLLQTVVNPARVGYFKRIIQQDLKLPCTKMRALEIGCGGGILSEEIAALGFVTTGMDPSAEALDTARKHAEKSGLNIDYVSGQGEELPFNSGAFDVAFCCDVLEHVQDLNKVISEIARVLKPGGYFFYDTLNRTFLSKLVAIKLWQDWRAFAFMPKNLHVWEMFIKPNELTEHFQNNGLINIHTTGLATSVNPLKMIYYMRQRVRKHWKFSEFTKRIQLKESLDMSILYAGYARK